jgi:hypothetical protein
MPATVATLVTVVLAEWVVLVVLAPPAGLVARVVPAARAVQEGPLRTVTSTVMAATAALVAVALKAVSAARAPVAMAGRVATAV